MEAEKPPFLITETEKEAILKQRDENFVKAKKKALKEQLAKIQKELDELDPKPEPSYDLPYRSVNPWTGPSADDV